MLGPKDGGPPPHAALLDAVVVTAVWTLRIEEAIFPQRTCSVIVPGVSHSMCLMPYKTSFVIPMIMKLRGTFLQRKSQTKTIFSLSSNSERQILSTMSWSQREITHNYLADAYHTSAPVCCTFAAGRFFIFTEVVIVYKKSRSILPQSSGQLK